MALDDIYYKRPYAPAQDTNAQMGQAFGQLPDLARSREEALARQAETERNNRPVTAWEKAAARLFAGHDAKSVAADVKAELAGGGGSQGMGSMGAPQGVGMDPSELQQYNAPQGLAGAQPYSGPDLTLPSGAQAPTNDISGMGNIFKQAADRAQQGGRPQMPPPDMGSQQGGLSSIRMQQGDTSQPSEDIYAGMTHRDWQDYMGALEKGKIAQLNQQRPDHAVEVANIRAGAVTEAAKTRAEGAKDVAETNAGSKKETTEARINQRKEEIKQKHQETTEWQKIAREKIMAMERMSSERVKSGAKMDPGLRALIELYKADVNGHAKITSSDSYILDEKAAKDAEDLRAKADETEARIRAHLETKPAEVQTTEKVKTEASKKAPIGAQHKIGDKVNLKGVGEVTIKKILPDGKFEY